MAREKYVLDYVVKSSPAILYNFLVSSSGLAQWFADKVDFFESTYTFVWDGYPEEAEVLAKEENVFIRYQMAEHEGDEYLELRIEKSPITDDTILIVSDYADDDEIDDQIILWNAQIIRLKGAVGGGN